MRQFEAKRCITPHVVEGNVAKCNTLLLRDGYGDFFLVEDGNVCCGGYHTHHHPSLQRDEVGFSFPFPFSIKGVWGKLSLSLSVSLLSGNR
jgi:hypothetical protein